MSTKSWIFHFAIKNKEITSQRKPEFERYLDELTFGKEIFSWKLNTNTEDFSNKLLRPTDEGLHAHETK